MINHLKDLMKFRLEELRNNKRGFVKMGTGIIQAAFVGLILIAILFEAAAVLIPLVQTSAGTLCDSGIPMATMFKNNGVVILLLVGALILAVVGSMQLKKGK